MLRKTHSNRDPRDTLFSELKKEFKPRLDQVRCGVKQVLVAKPKLLFGFMVSLLLASAILSFTVFRQHERQKTEIKKTPEPLKDGFGQIMQITEQLRETMSLKHTVDSLSILPKLSRTDSVRLETSLDRLRDLDLLKNKHHEH